MLIIFIDYKVKRALRVLQILGGQFYNSWLSKSQRCINSPWDPPETFLKLPIKQHAVSVLHGKTWNFPPFSSKQVLCSSVTRSVILTEHTLHLESHCELTWTWQLNGQGRECASPPWKQVLKPINQSSSVKKKERKKKPVKESEGVITGPCCSVVPQLCRYPQSLETNSGHVKPRLDNDVPGLPHIPVCRCECKW